MSKILTTELTAKSKNWLESAYNQIINEVYHSPEPDTTFVIDHIADDYLYLEIVKNGIGTKQYIELEMSKVIFDLTIEK